MNRRDMLLSATLMAAGIAGSQLSSSAATAATSDEKKSPARNVNEAVVRYLAAWNERDPSRRLELVAKAPRMAPTSIACAMAAGTMKSMP